VIEHRGKVDRRRVAADADCVDRARRRCGGKNHEAQRKGRKAPDQTQSEFSASNSRGQRKLPNVAAINDMKAKEIKGFPVTLR